MLPTYEEMKETFANIDNGLHECMDFCKYLDAGIGFSNCLKGHQILNPSGGCPVPADTLNCPLFEKNLAEDERRPDSKKHYDVWLEGFSCTGQYCADEFLGNYIADSFKEACKLALEEHYSDEDMKKFYNEENNTFYGCRMYKYNPGHF